MSELPSSRTPPSRTAAPVAADGLVPVPRLWLVLLTVLVLLPWLAVATFWWDDRQAPSEPAVAPSSRTAATVGPWGELRIRPITISPPVEYVPRTWGEVQPSVWHFPLVTGDELERYLVSLGLSSADAQRLRATSRASSVGTLLVTPDEAMAVAMTPEVRARLYTELGRVGVQHGTDLPINYDQVTSYRYYGSSLDDWLNPDMITPATRRLVEPYVYASDGFLYFADIERVRPAISDSEELQRLAKVLLRHATMLVEVALPDRESVSAVAEYWGRGGRRTDLEPLLESVARGASGGAIDINHLVPTIMRDYLYRYPRPTVEDFERPLLANCLWTALNFFEPTPDDRYLDPAVAIATLKSDYYLVQDNFQLGDVVAFSDASGNLVHVAVYLAGDLVFSKNGTSALAPWSILPIDRLSGHYIEYSGDWRITYHRRSDM